MFLIVDEKRRILEILQYPCYVSRTKHGKAVLAEKDKAEEIYSNDSNLYYPLAHGGTESCGCRLVYVDSVPAHIRAGYHQYYSGEYSITGEALDTLEKEGTLAAITAVYAEACAMQDEERAARTMRKWREILLSESDKEMVFDRLEIKTGSSEELLSSIASLFAGKWSCYRQSLRDIPEQEGFPFKVVFPVKPGDIKKEE